MHCLGIRGMGDAKGSRPSRRGGVLCKSEGFVRLIASWNVEGKFDIPVNAKKIPSVKTSCEQQHETKKD